MTMLSDADGRASPRPWAMQFDAPAAGLDGRSKRYAMYVVDGVVKVFDPEVGRGCEISGGESLLAQI